jgi:hypothetical protein
LTTLSDDVETLRVNLGVQGVESADVERVRADLAAANALCGAKP